MKETRLVHTVFPGETNHYGTLFGGTALAWMDRAAFVAATRHARRKVVTVHSDAVDFKRPVPLGSIVELVARVAEVGRTSMRVEEILARLEGFLRHLPPERLWVNPDCGLKTRKPEEAMVNLRNMVEASKRLRERMGGKDAHGA